MELTLSDKKRMLTAAAVTAEALGWKWAVHWARAPDCEAALEDLFDLRRSRSPGLRNGDDVVEAARDSDDDHHRGRGGVKRKKKT